MPVPYCHPIDVLRRFDPSIDLGDLEPASPNVFGIDSAEQIQARIRSASQEWDRDTGTPLRLRRVGSPGAPATYEYHNARRQPNRYPLKVDLDGDDVIPPNPSAGDVLEVRTGRDSWEDVTDQEGDEWVLVPETGALKLFRVLIHRIWFEAADERYLRATYRHGSLGGDRDRGGQTALSSSVALDDTETTLSVADASRVPYDGGVVLLPEQDPQAAEYVRITDVDTDADTLTAERGVQGTGAAAHDSGTAVHYAPEDVRDAVAAKAVADLVRYDLSAQRQDGDNAAVSPSRKLDDWQREWQETKARYSAVRRL